MEDNNNKWVRRNITDDFRVKDMVEMYEAMGYQVKVEDYLVDNCDSDCNTCLIEFPEQFKVIFTRKNENIKDELFGDLQ